MIKRNRFEDDESVVISADSLDLQSTSRVVTSGGVGGSSKATRGGYKGWLDRTQLTAAEVQFLESKENDDLEQWVREAALGIWKGKPSVGLVEFAIPPAVFHTVREYAKKAEVNGVTVHVFDKFAGQYPLHLVEMRTLWEVAKVSRHDDYIQASSHEVVQVADVLSMELNLRPIILVVCIDIRESMTDADYRVSKAIVRSCLSEGCPVLMVYSDSTSFKELDRRGFFDNGDIPLVRIR